MKKRKLQNHTQNIGDTDSSSSSCKRMRQFRGILARNQEQEPNQQEINALLPGLPDHLAMLCLARVPSLTNLWGISSAWQSLLYTSHFFHSIRAQLGHHNLSWLYALIAQDHFDSEDSAADTSDSFPNSSRISFAWYAFDPLAFLWHKLPPMPPDIRFELSRPGFLGPYPHPIQCISTQTKLILVAGTRASSSSSSSLLPFGSKSVAVEPALDRPLVFDVAAATWSRGPRYAVPRRWCTCGTARGKVLLASGVGSEWDVDTAKAAEVWDVAAAGKTWRQVSRLASTKLSREATQAVDVGGRLHMVSARVGTVFDLETGGWAPMAPGMSRGWNGPCVVSRGRLLAVDDTAGRIREYDKGTDSWAVVVDDERLKSLGNVVAAADGKICGSVDGTIRIVDLDGEKIGRFREVKIPIKGQVVSLQILSGMVIDLEI